MSEEEKELISVREAAQECGKNAETVRRWIWSGKLPAQKLGNQLFIKRSDFASYCRETAVKYRAEPEADFLEKAEALRERIRARTSQELSGDEIVDTIHGMREERMKQIEKSISDTAAIERDRQAKLNFLKKATAIRNRIHARTGKVFNVEALIRELREEREDELE